MSSNLVRISIQNLQLGHYVHLELSWIDHPFSLNKFKLTTPDQLATLRGLRLQNLLVDLSKSDVRSASPVDSSPQPIENTAAVPDPAQSEAIIRKRERIAQNQALRSRVAVAERQFMQGARVCRELNQTIFSNPRESLGQVSALITQAADALLTNRDAIVHLLGDRVGGEEVYHHSLNVSMLALLLGKELGLSRETLETIGLAAVLHDIGKVEVPTQILLKRDTWTAPERELFRQHVAFGTTILQKAGVSQSVLDIVAQHHEMADGSGYPKGLKADQMLEGGRLLSLVNEYDNLCNPTDFNKAMTPHEALSLMFSKYRTRFDAAMMSKFVHILGVYPPGCVVALSNEAVGMVMSVNASKPLRPVVLVYDENIPKSEAIILNLEEEPGIAIAKALRPNQLARPVYDYLSPRQRITYSFDTQPGAES